MKSKPLIIYLLISLIMFSCAQQASLSGGDIDEIPPTLIKAEPAEYSTNFNHKNVRLYFDEFVQLNNIFNQLIISPIMEPAPDVFLKGKSVIIKNFPDTLRQNSTYVLNFGDAIADITENNPNKNFRYVFSTGTYIDSLYIRGKIIDAFTLAPKADMFVQLYDSLLDSIPYLLPPRYIGRTDENGNFKIENIKEGYYKIFALQDIGNNYLFDNPEEIIGFSDTSVVAKSDSLSLVEIKVFKEENPIQYTKFSGQGKQQQFFVSFNLPANEANFSFPEEDFSMSDCISEWDENNDSLSFWLPTSWDKESLKLIVDDQQNEYSDTVEIYAVEAPKKSKKKIKITAEVSQLGFIEKEEQLIIRLPFPIATFDTSKFLLLRDSAKIPFEIKRSETSKRVLELSHEWKEDSKYEWVVADSAIVFYDEQTSDSSNMRYSSRKLKDYGSLALRLDIPTTNHLIVQLFKGQNELISEIVLENNRELQYAHLLPGKYIFKIIEDENKNGKWDTGNYLQKKQPEKIFIYNGEIVIRSNWDQELDWIIQ